MGLPKIAKVSDYGAEQMESFSKSADELTDQDLFTPVPLLALILGQGTESTASLALKQREAIQKMTMIAF